MEDDVASPIQINGEAFRQLRWAHGLQLNKDFAQAIGINAGTTSRIMQGVSAPGGKFIGNVLENFPVRFEEMFVLTDEGEAEVADTGHAIDELAVLGDDAAA